MPDRLKQIETTVEQLIAYHKQIPDSNLLYLLNMFDYTLRRVKTAEAVINSLNSKSKTWLSFDIGSIESAVGNWRLIVEEP